MVQGVLARLGHAFRTTAAHVVWFWDAVAPVEKNLDDLVVVSVRGENNRRDVGREGTGRNSPEKALCGDRG